MPAYHVERSITINAPLKEINDTLRDFRQWPKWSPWLVMEPDAVLTYTDRQGQVGATYAWAGHLVGAGSMELIEVHDRCLKMELNFRKPFKSSAIVRFDLASSEEGVEVIWQMDGNIPFFMFWMQSRLKAYIGMDYRRGLLMLKEYIETGKVDSFVHIEGVLPLPEGRYTGIARSCAIEDLSVVMRRDFETLYDFMQENGLSADRIPFAVYEAFDIPRGTTEYIAAIPLEEEMTLPKRWVTGELPGGKGLKTMHKGAYEHLGNAWTTAMQFVRYQKIATAKRPVGYEFYPNDPHRTRREELVTEIYMPLKENG